MDILDEIVNQSRQIFDDELIGIYLHNLVLSKKQGGEWAIDNLPSCAGKKDAFFDGKRQFV